jgi:hypothetical protein
MNFYPTGLDLPNLEHWFPWVLAWANDNTFVVGPGFGVPSCPSVRGMVAHAHLIVRHHGLPDSPREPCSPLDREGYVIHLREVLDFLRRGLSAAGLTSSIQASEQVTVPWPCLLSASDLAAKLGLEKNAVEVELRRYHKYYPDCAVDVAVDSCRRNEPRFLSRVADVLSHLKTHFLLTDE